MPAAADTVPNWDGIVMAHGSVGSIGTASPTTSVVLTHEIGHYLNLQHIWGGNNVPNFPYLPVADPGNCSYDDGVADTPNTIGWQVCSTGGTSCGTLDNVQNFMDYAYCPVMFTEGQKQRMHATLNSPIANRNNLWTPANLVATGTDGTTYFCKTDFTASKTKICTGQSIQFTDASYNGVDSWSWEFEGGTPAVSNDTNPLIQYNTPGIYKVKLVSANGLETDSLEVLQMIEVFEDTGLPEFMLYHFEANSSLENSIWYTNNYDGQIGWEIDSTVGYNSNRCIKIENYNNTKLQVDELISRPLDLSNATSIDMTFQYAYTKKNGDDLDKLQVLVSDDCGLTWDVRKTLVSTVMMTVSDTLATPFTPSNSGEWATSTITNITSGYWVNDFRVMFKFESGGGNNIYIDNINILDPTTTSIDDFGNNLSFTSYPNPAKDQLVIESNQLISKIIISDLAGKLVQEISLKNFSTSKTQINLENISNGLYLISIINKTGNSKTNKILISK